jgi:CheY-like chemotaxis protein
MSTDATSNPSPPHFVAFVDDEVDFVGAVYDLLCGEFGAEKVAAFTNPLEADKWLSDNCPRILVADVRMPRMNGIELVTRARGRWPNLPVIITTAYPSEVTDKLLTERAFHYLPKPFSFDALVQLLWSIHQAAEKDQAEAASEVLEILTLYTMAGYSGSLTGYAVGWPSAHVWVRDGRILHAQCGNLVGIDGLSALLAMPRGAFDWAADTEPMTSIDMTLPDALRVAKAATDTGRLVLPPGGTVDDVRAREVFSGSHANTNSQQLLRSSGSSIVADNPFGDDPPEVEVDLLSPTGNHPVVPHMELDMANNINDILAELQGIEGFIAAAVADSNSGMTLGKVGGGSDFNIELAAASNTEVVKAKHRAMKALKLTNERIEDILITLGSQYHLIRPLEKRPEVFVYVALDRRRANLAVARFAVADAEEKLVM